jgi:hypothetical protein
MLRTHGGIVHINLKNYNCEDIGFPKPGIRIQRKEVH